jgi:hypothetical protein
MFEAFIEWRKEIDADNAMVIYRFPELPELKLYYEHGYHMTDREGRPVWIDRPWQANIDACYDLVDPDMMMKYYVSEYERLIHWKLPAWSAAYGSNVDSTFSIVDCKGFNMGMMNKKGREFLKIASTLGENYYPDIMWNMYVINTPFIFKAAWVAIKPFISEKSRNRIKLFGSKYHKELFKIVDQDNLPEKVGGNCTWEHRGGNCFIACPGPWDDHPGDEFGEAATKKIQELDDDELEYGIKVNIPKKSKKTKKDKKKKSKRSYVEEDFKSDDVDFDQVTQSN